MAWMKSVTGVPVCVELLIADDCGALDSSHTPEAGENILELARLAAHKTFCKLGVWHEQRARYFEDAVQEAAAVIAQYADRGPATAYGIAKRRIVRWIIEQVWQGKHWTRKQKREGIKTLLPAGPSLDAMDWEPLLQGEVGYALTPEEILVKREEVDEREASIERFFDIVYDLIAYQMGLERRRHYTALNDAEVFQLTLRGYTLEGIAQEMNSSEDLARQRVSYARRRLEDFLNEHGIEQVASWYEGVAHGGASLTNARAQEAFVASYVAEQQAAYEERLGASPKRRQCEKWKTEARERWAAHEQEQQRQWAPTAVVAD